jgi:hypothetical protein
MTGVDNVSLCPYAFFEARGTVKVNDYRKRKENIPI